MSPSEDLRSPAPGHQVRGSKTGRPIMALFDLLGRRWALRILWEVREDALSFRALQTACGDISPSVLSRRLAELRGAGVLEHEAPAGYRLTVEGHRLLQMLLPLARWADDWAERRAAQQRD